MQKEHVETEAMKIKKNKNNLKNNRHKAIPNFFV